LPAAVAAYEKCFALNDPDQIDPPACFNTWAFAAAGYVSALVDLGRATEAREFGLRAFERCRAQEATWAEAVESEVAICGSCVG